MEEPVKEQQPYAPATGKSKLRYPLRSSMKPKEEKPSAGSLSTSSSRRGRASPSVSKSMGVLDLSKEKSAKPPRRLSIPTKSYVTPSAAKSLGTITPISEARAKKSTNGQAKTDTPRSDASRTATRRRFNVLSSVSYWISQIKLSESASKHSVSLGFFKLALEAGCGPLDKMHEEIRSYIRRHNLDENEESIKELLLSYNVLGKSGQPQVSETCSQVPEEGPRSSDDEIHSASSPVGSRKLKCKSLNTAAAQATLAADPAKETTPRTNSGQPQVSGNCTTKVPEGAQSSDDEIHTSAIRSRKLKPKSLNTSAAQVSSVVQPPKETIRKNTPETRNRAMNKSISISRAVSDKGSHKLEKRAQKTTKPEPVKGKDMTKRQEIKSPIEEGQINPTAAAETVQENKENMDAPLTEVIA